MVNPILLTVSLEKLNKFAKLFGLIGRQRIPYDFAVVDILGGQVIRKLEM